MHADISNIKINFTLDILGLKDDGYHEIDSLFFQVGYGDEVVFDKESPNPLEVSGFKVPEDESNLVWKAHELFCDFFKIKKEGGFKLDKKIPPGSGFGSGSSNVWSVFKILSKCYGLNPNEKQIKEMSMELGSDVFYFSKGGFCRVRGVGEIIEKIDVGTVDLNVVFGTVDDAVLTKDAYGWWDKSSFSSRKNTAYFLENYSFEKDFSNSRNDFEEVVLQKREKMNSFLTLCKKDGIFCSMTGSGNGIFTICKNKDELIDSIKLFEKHCNYGPNVGRLIV